MKKSFMQRLHATQESLYDMTAHIGKPVTSPLVFINEFFVIIAKQVQDGGLKIMYVNGILDDIISQLVRFAVDDSRFYTASSHPDTKATRMVITAIITVLKRSLTIVGTSKFSTPDDQRFIQHAAVLQILY